MDSSTYMPPEGASKRTLDFTILSRLTFFLYWIGIHRFYVGKPLTGSAFILLFFTQVTCKQMTQDPESMVTMLGTAAQLVSLGWGMWDLILVAFGRFEDADGDTVKLSIQQSVPSQVPFGPMFVWACVFGIFGAHHFYAKNPRYGLMQAFTLGGLGLWILWDIWCMTKGTFKDGQGLCVAHLYQKDPHVDVST